MGAAFILSVVDGHFFSKVADSAMVVFKQHITEKEFADILDRFDQQFIRENDAQITLCKCDVQSLIEKRSFLLSLAIKYINQDNADISRNLKQIFIETARGEIFGYADWKKEKSSEVVGKYLYYFYDLVFMKETSEIPSSYRAVINSYINTQHDINQDHARRITDLETRTKESQSVEQELADFELYYQEVERRFTSKKRGDYKNLVGEEPDETSYIDAYITKNEKQISVLSFLEEWVGTTEPGVILIHGEPGHGKTMLCDKAMFEFYKGRFLKEKAKNVVAVSLNTGKNIRIIDNGEVKLENALVWGTAPKRKFTFEACHGSLLFLDGFDEFIDKAKEANIRNIHSFMDTVDEIAAKYGIYIVLLSRTIAISKDQESLARTYECYELSPITDEQQDKWLELHNEYDDYREAFIKLRNDKDMQKLLRVPFLFRLIVNIRFDNVTSNIVELYNNLFVHLMHKREIDDKNDLEIVEEELMNLAFEVYCTDTYMAKIEWNPKWTFAFYVKSDNGDKIGFFHRTFYQYFLAKYIFSRIINITDENVEDFIGSFAERELDNTVRQYLSLMFIKEDKSRVFPNIEKMIDTLINTEAYISSIPRVKSGDAERSKIRRSTNIYRNTLHIAFAVSYVIQIPFNQTLGLMVRTFDSTGIRIYSEENKSPYLIGADLRGAYLSRACLSRVDLRAADLRGAFLDKADLSRARLDGADLRGVDLSGADLSSASLRVADLRGACLSGTNLSGADLVRADLTGGFLVGANMMRTNLREAIIDIKYKAMINPSAEGYSFIKWISVDNS